MDEKFLDGPNVGYCSDSDEGESLTAARDDGLSSSRDVPQGSVNTGPKGVLTDYAHHQQNLVIERKLKELEVSP